MGRVFNLGQEDPSKIPRPEESHPKSHPVIPTGTSPDEPHQSRVKFCTHSILLRKKPIDEDFLFHQQHLVALGMPLQSPRNPRDRGANAPLFL